MRLLKPTSAEEDQTCPSALELAAWVDRRLTPGESERIEVHLARCPDCLTLVAGLDAELGDLRAASVAGSIAPERAIAAARDLVPKATGPGFHVGSFLWRGFAAAAAIAAAWAGFVVGGSLSAFPSGASDALRDGPPLASASESAGDIAFDAPEDTALASDADAESTAEGADYLTFGLLGDEPETNADTVELACRLFLLLEVSP